MIKRMKKQIAEAAVEVYKWSDGKKDYYFEKPKSNEVNIPAYGSAEELSTKSKKPIKMLKISDFLQKLNALDAWPDESDANYQLFDQMINNLKDGEADAGSDEFLPANSELNPGDEMPPEASAEMSSEVPATSGEEETTLEPEPKADDKPVTPESIVNRNIQKFIYGIMNNKLDEARKAMKKVIKQKSALRKKKLMKEDDSMGANADEAGFAPDSLEARVEKAVEVSGANLSSDDIRNVVSLIKDFYGEDEVTEEDILDAVESYDPEDIDYGSDQANYAMASGTDNENDYFGEAKIKAVKAKKGKKPMMNLKKKVTSKRNVKEGLEAYAHLLRNKKDDDRAYSWSLDQERKSDEKMLADREPLPTNDEAFRDQIREVADMEGIHISDTHVEMIAAYLEKSGKVETLENSDIVQAIEALRAASRSDLED